MEAALIEKFSHYLRRGDSYFKERRFEDAYDSYMDGLYTLGAYLMYRDMGMLIPQRELTGFLESRYPEIYDIILRFSSLSHFEEESVRALRDELQRLRGVMTSPSSEG
ncbi:hypothetical protein [Thermococcus sp.]|uniref:hypothetical protein n=1 Tax=Thermococcus sp. TaxID=35749 RepID=UPI0025D429B7|nr:hypothetical protein [Thermococcus sp.]